MEPNRHAGDDIGKKNHDKQTYEQTRMTDTNGQEAQDRGFERLSMSAANVCYSRKSSSDVRISFSSVQFSQVSSPVVRVTPCSMVAELMVDINRLLRL